VIKAAKGNSKLKIFQQHKYDPIIKRQAVPLQKITV
jgi:hypothetical protein